MEDHLLIEKIRAGDPAPYAELVRKYEVRIRQLCFSMLSNYEEAQDAAQEIFVKAFYALERFKGNASFYTWVYRIASNHCLDKLRKKSRRHEESWEALLEAKGDKIERLLSSDSKEESTQNQELVWQVLSHLPPDYRLVLTLREIQGLTYEEIGETLHCSLDAVKGRLKRAREDFKHKLRHFLSSKTV